jgi:hypothetical protein
LSLPSSCPICEHSPLSAEDCNPNKALRTTIKVFLRTAEKKREAQRAKEATPVTPVEPSKPLESPTDVAAPKPEAGAETVGEHAEGHATNVASHPEGEAAQQSASAENQQVGQQFFYWLYEGCLTYMTE